MLKDEDKMTFGCHKGQKMMDVPPRYLDWLSAQDWTEKKYPAVWAYIERCRKAIDKELDEAGQIPYRKVGKK